MPYNPERDPYSPLYWLNLGNTNRGDFITLAVSGATSAFGYGVFQAELRNPSVPESIEDFLLLPPFGTFLLGGAVAVAAGALIVNRNVRAFIHSIRTRS